MTSSGHAERLAMQRIETPGGIGQVVLRPGHAERLAMQRIETSVRDTPELLPVSR